MLENNSIFKKYALPYRCIVTFINEQKAFWVITALLQTRQFVANIVANPLVANIGIDCSKVFTNIKIFFIT